jgi:hypothetical protein
MTVTQPLGAADPASVTRVAVKRPARTAIRRAPASRRRTLAGYLVMPRPGDAVKALLMPLTFGLGLLAAGGADTHAVLRAVIALMVLELLVYPARYQWNDVRGFAADQRHPAEADRGRLPGPVTMCRRRVIASAAVAALRLAAALAVATVPGLHLGGTVAAIVLGVFGVAIAYEVLRSAATGRSAAAVPPVTPALTLLWIAVGAGYVVRGLIGLSLAINLAERPALGVAAAVTLWAYGVAFVTSRWAVESLAFAQVRDGRVTWTADAAHAREHLLALTRWLPPSIEPHTVTASTDRPADGWAPLRGRTAIGAPWNLALTVAGAAAAVTGLLLTEPSAAGRWTVAVVGGLTSLAVALLPRLRPLVVALGAAALFVLFVLGATPQPLVSLLPWVGVMVAYLHFSAQSMNSMGNLGRVTRATLTRLFAPIARLALGQETWELLTNGGTARE